MRNHVTYIWIGAGFLLIVFGFVRLLLPRESKAIVSSPQDSTFLRLVAAQPTNSPDRPAPTAGAQPSLVYDNPTSAPPPTQPTVGPATQVPPPAATATLGAPPPVATATPNPAPQATATTAPAPTRPQGGVTKPNGQVWYPPGPDGLQRVDGPCGNPSCIGYWDPVTQSWATASRPGASTPVPKKPASSGSSGNNPTPTPKPVALSTLLSATPTLGKACKSTTSCVDVKITYESNTGLVIKGSENTPADLNGVSYVEFTIAGKKYRIIVTGGVPQVDARPQ